MLLLFFKQYILYWNTEYFTNKKSISAIRSLFQYDTYIFFPDL